MTSQDQFPGQIGISAGPALKHSVRMSWIAITLLACLQEAQAQDRIYLDCEGIENYIPSSRDGSKSTSTQRFFFEISEDRSQVTPLVGHPIFAFKNCRQDDAAVKCRAENEPDPPAGKTASKTYSVVFSRLNGDFSINYMVRYPDGPTTWAVSGHCKPRNNKQLF